jgi:hypothetical protein
MRLGLALTIERISNNSNEKKLTIAFIMLGINMEELGMKSESRLYRS